MLYTNNEKLKTEDPGVQGDLFGYRDLTPPHEDECPAEDLDIISEQAPDAAGVTPETLPLIQESVVSPSPAKSEAPKKAPLIFSARAPIPTRGGIAPEEENERRKRIIEQTAREIPPLMLDQIPPDASLGKVLIMARENAAYTIENVTDITRISNNNIISLETGNFKRLPSYIYRVAYLRELCKLYKLPQETADFIYKLHDQVHDKNDAARQRELSTDMKNVSAEERRANWIFTGVIATIGLVIILAIWAVIIALVKHNGEKEAYQQQTVNTPAVQPSAAPVNFDQRKLENLTPVRILDLRTLEMSNSGKTRE